ncbi:MAG: T9SS type A sorting domain-containing protein [Bacteroidales bacterium]
MKKLAWIALLVSFGTMLEAQVDVNKYLWQYPLEQNLFADPEMKMLLQEQMQKIIDTGTLCFRPMTCRYSDQVYENYFLYQEPGRILQTSALAYPHLPAAQQTALRLMVPALLASTVHAPWSPNPQARDAGIRREFYAADDIWGLNSGFGMYRPTIQGVYSLWLYLYRTGDTSAIQPWYEQIRTFYNNKCGAGVDPGNLYGTMSAHIGMARLATIFNDTAQVTVASGRIASNLQNGLDMHYVDSMAFYGKQGWNAPYANEYIQRNDNYLYRGFIFLNLSPEIGRYLQDTLYNQVVQRHNAGIQLFPFWWLSQAPYFVRWTGEEGVGIPTEMSGMIMPVERWVVHRDAATMRSYMQSAPTGVTDCYWIESLVYALESDATDSWVDVRTTPFTTDGTAVPVNAGINGIVPGGADTCFSATNTIVTGGAGQSFIISPGGHADLMAGQHILLKTGTIVHNSGYLHGRISTDGNYCSFNPPVSAMAGLTGTNCNQPGRRADACNRLSIYPNPTPGVFRVDLSALPGFFPTSLEIGNMMGERLLVRLVSPGDAQTIDLSGFPAGMYIVRVICRDGILSGKVVKR